MNWSLLRRWVSALLVPVDDSGLGRLTYAGHAMHTSAAANFFIPYTFHVLFLQHSLADLHQQIFQLHTDIDRSIYSS